MYNMFEDYSTIDIFLGLSDKEKRVFKEGMYVYAVNNLVSFLQKVRRKKIDKRNTDIVGVRRELEIFASKSLSVALLGKDRDLNITIDPDYLTAKSYVSPTNSFIEILDNGEPFNLFEFLYRDFNWEKLVVESEDLQEISGIIKNAVETSEDSEIELHVPFLHYKEDEQLKTIYSNFYFIGEKTLLKIYDILNKLPDTIMNKKDFQLTWEIPIGLLHGYDYYTEEEGLTDKEAKNKQSYFNTAFIRDDKWNYLVKQTQRAVKEIKKEKEKISKKNTTKK